MNYFILADAAQTPAREQSMWSPLIILLIAFVFFYFILWRPEQKRRKALNQQRSMMKVGDTVTAMGIVGTVTEVREKTAILKMYDGNSQIEVLLQAVTEVKPQTE